MRKLVLVILVLTLSGCASVGATRLGNTSYPSKPRNSQIDVYMGENSVKRPYVDVCLIDSRTGTTLFENRTVQQAIENAKPKARDYGADALVVIDGKTEGISLSGWGMGSAIIKAIKYLPETQN